MLLNELVAQKRCLFIDGADTWQEAVRLSCAKLEADGSVDGTYADQIIRCVERHGPYIVITPGVALPHAQEKAAGVSRTAVAFMKSERPVVFEAGNPDGWARLFFTVCSVDPEAHLKNIAALCKILSDEALCEALMAARSEADLLRIAAQYGESGGCA